MIRVYLGYEWLSSGWEKIYGGSFDAGGFIQGAIHKTSGEHPAVQPWFGSFLEHVALPHVSVFNVLVPWGEFLVGIGLILGVCTTFAVLMGMVMNFAYLMAGTVSTNAQLLLLEIFVIVSGYNAGRIGLDYFLFRSFHRRQKTF